MSTPQPVVYLRNTLTLADDLSQFDINLQLLQARIEHPEYKIVELDSSTERQQLVFTGYQLGAITAHEAYAGAWWAYDHCIVIFTVYPDGRTKIELVSTLDSLMKIKSDHVIGDQLYSIIYKHECLSIHEPDGTFYPSVYDKHPEKFKFIDDDITSYIELRNQVILNEIDTGAQMVGLKVVPQDGKPNLMFCGEQIATDISFSCQIDLYRAICGKFVCHIQKNRFLGRIEHKAEVFLETEKPPKLSHKLQRELVNYMEYHAKNQSFNFRQRRRLMN